MVKQSDLTQNQLFRILKKELITFAGNRKLKIYGKLNCTSGKRIKKVNRVFFKDVAEAKANGFRPCGHCMQEEYEDWKRVTTF